MCLVVYTNSVTQQAMRVYKVLIKSGDKYYSPFQYKPYSIGKTYRTDSDNTPHLLNFKEPFTAITKEAIHAYINLYAAELFKKGYHGSSKNVPFDLPIEYVITEWEIPEDTVYWISCNEQEIAATKMTFIKEINRSHSYTY